MEITSIKQLESLKPPIDPPILERTRKVLEDGGRIRLYAGTEEVEADPRLSGEEKEFALECFTRGLSWAIVSNPKPKAPEWWARPMPPDSSGGWYDTHGNYHSGGGNPHGSIH